MKYPYDSTKCTIDTNDCDKFWQVNESTNNIECVQTCSGYIIHKNLYEPQIIKPQCVQNCQTIFNPLELGNPNSLLFYTCDFQKYCLNLEYCQLKNLEYDDKECFRPLECFDIDDYSNVENSTNGKNANKIYKRVKLIKYYEFENINFEYFGNNIIKNQMVKYLMDLNKELAQHKEEYLGGIYFIT